MALKHPDGRVIVKIDLEGKNSWRFSDGTTIRYERQFNNLNRRQTEPVNGICISGEGIKEGAEILVHHNAAEEINEILNYRQTSGSSIRYYSIPVEQCFFWHDGGTWQPLPPYETALRVFKPYKGLIQGVEPELLKDTLFVTSGELKGEVVRTIKAADYQVVFQDINGKEGNIIRFRPNGDERTKREPEAVAVLNEVTGKVNSGEYLVGYELSDAKKLNDAD